MTSSADRIISRYDVHQDRSERHPDWTVTATDLGGLGEVIDVPRRTILVDPSKHGVRYAVAHALAHLDLEHVCERGGGAFTPQQEADAHWLAVLRLDVPRWRSDGAAPEVDEWDDVPMDGDPTLYR